MSHRIIFIFTISTFLFSCNNKKDKYSFKPADKIIRHTIAILPFNHADIFLTGQLKINLEKSLLVECSVIKNEPLPFYAFYKPRQRYIADSLLAFLHQINNKRFEKIIGVTAYDISTTKKPYDNWGVLGLGNCPGETCVISSFRTGSMKISSKLYLRRITILALHELGHTYGLKHCPAGTCIMKEAEGKMNLDEAKGYCEKCRQWLMAKNILK